MQRIFSTGAAVAVLMVCWCAGALGGDCQARNGVMGKAYDLYFEWSDERIYRSELVWKVYDRGAGVQIGKRQTMADFDLTHPASRSSHQGPRAEWRSDPGGRIGDFARCDIQHRQPGDRA